MQMLHSSGSGEGDDDGELDGECDGDELPPQQHLLVLSGTGHPQHREIAS